MHALSGGKALPYRVGPSSGLQFPHLPLPADRGPGWINPALGLMHRWAYWISAAACAFLVLVYMVAFMLAIGALSVVFVGVAWFAVRRNWLLRNNGAVSAPADSQLTRMPGLFGAG